MAASSSSVGQESVGRYVLGLEVSERSIKWPLGTDNHASVFRQYSDVRSVYSKHIDHCRFDELCAVSCMYNFFEVPL